MLRDLFGRVQWRRNRSHDDKLRSVRGGLGLDPPPHLGVHVVPARVEGDELHLLWGVREEHEHALIR